MTDWRAILAVALGAAAGGVTRYSVGVWTVARFGTASAWLATGFINISGAFLIGIVLELSLRTTSISPVVRLLLATGFLGGYTTFSTFAWETLTLGAEGSRLLALAYAVGSVVLGLIAAYAGSALTRLAVR